MAGQSELDDLKGHFTKLFHDSVIMQTINLDYYFCWLFPAAVDEVKKCYQCKHNTDALLMYSPNTTDLWLRRGLQEKQSSSRCSFLEYISFLQLGVRKEISIKRFRCMDKSHMFWCVLDEPCFTSKAHKTRQKILFLLILPAYFMVPEVHVMFFTDKFWHNHWIFCKFHHFPLLKYLLLFCKPS